MFQITPLQSTWRLVNRERLWCACGQGVNRERLWCACDQGVNARQAVHFMMDGWMYGWMDGWMDEWVDVWVDV